MVEWRAQARKNLLKGRRIGKSNETQATPEKMQDVFELKPHVMGSDGDG
jgi:hypothetical protein